MLSCHAIGVGFIFVRLYVKNISRGIIPPTNIVQNNPFCFYLFIVICNPCTESNQAIFLVIAPILLAFLPMFLNCWNFVIKIDFEWLKIVELNHLVFYRPKFLCFTSG